ncbi:type VI secretion system-associated FHA domain protein [Pseudomonas sp. microsymbiont 2]
MKGLTLTIVNLENLAQGVATRHRFGRNGGTIGRQGADWLIVDRERRIEPIHCEIRWKEGSFCVIDRSHRTYLNQSTQSLGAHAPVRLRDGDRLRVGAYQLQVSYQAGQQDERSLESLLTPGQRALDALLANTSTTTLDEPRSPAITDICEAFPPVIGHDPLAALDTHLAAAPGQDNALRLLIKGERP